MANKRLIDMAIDELDRATGNRSPGEPPEGIVVGGDVRRKAPGIDCYRMRPKIRQGGPYYTLALMMIFNPEPS